MPAPKLSRCNANTLTPEMHQAWQRSMTLRGDATFFEVFGHRPDLYDFYLNDFYRKLFHGGRVSRRIKELVRLQLSTLHGCRFCNQGNRADARDAGINAEAVDALPDYQGGPFSAEEKAALALADEMALTHPAARMSDACYQRLREHFDDGQILELGMVMGILAGMARFMFAFDLVEKEPNCTL